MSAILVVSILLRLVGVAYSIVLLARSGDRRFAFLTVMLGLMASRQLWTAQSATGGGLEEVPGLVVSVLAVATVHYLAEYVDEETRIKSELEATNDRLRSFRKAVEHAGHAIFLTDPNGRIEYANPATEDVTGYDPSEVVGETPRLWKSGRHDDVFYDDLWETITAGRVWEGEIVNEGKDGDLCWVDMTIAPITDDGDVEQFVAVDTDVTERKERERRIRDQNDRLELLNTTNEVIRDVHRELVQADTTSEIETVACEQFAGAIPYESAWIATRAVVDDMVRSRTSTGLDEETLADVIDAVNDADRETVVYRALRTETTQIARACDEAGDDDCECYDSAGAGATVAIPLSYRNARYGALVLHASDGDAADALDVEVLDELGETIAYAITAAESQQSLVSDRVTELTFELTPEDDPLSSLAAAADCELELERITTDAEGDLVEYVRLRGVDADEIREYVTDVDDVAAVQPIYDADELLVRVTVPGTSTVDTLANYGAVVGSLAADGTESTLVAELATTADVRSVVEAVSEAHPGADLARQRERDRTPDTRGRFRSTVEDRVTARQLEALQLAHFGGFFAWPRESSGDELADRMGVSQSTFLQHLRAGQRKVFEAFFDPDRATDTGRPRGIAVESD